MSANLKEEILEICHEIENLGEEDFTWQYIRKLYNKGKKEIDAAKSAGITEEIEESEASILVSVASEAIYKFVEAANEGGEEIPAELWPSNDDLIFFQEIADQMPKVFSLLEKEDERKIKDDDKKLLKLKKKNEQLKSFIQQERKKRGSSSTGRPNKTTVIENKPNPQDQQKFQNQQEEINSLKKQLAELQKKIAELKKKQTSNPEQSAVSSRQIQQKVSELQNQEKHIKKQLEQKGKVNSQINSYSSDSPDNKFNWLYVVIPGGILLMLVGIVAYLVIKKNKEVKH